MTDPAGKSELAELPRQPTIFMFQPSHYREVETPEELEKWEAAMAARVGGKFDPRAAGTRTVSFCGPVDPCDCDEI